MLCWPFELARLNKGLFFWGGQIAELEPMNGTAGGGKKKQKRENTGCPEPGNWGCRFGAVAQAGHTPGVTFAVCLVLLVWVISSAG